MRWEYCENCPIDGHCENQGRGHECEVYGKRMKDKCERLQKQLDIAVEFISMIDRRKIYMCNCLKGCPLEKYYEKNKGCATCVSNACHKTLKKIKEQEQ